MAVIGSTGSIGRQTLDVLGRLDERFAVVALAAGRDAQALCSQAERFRPRLAALGDPSPGARRPLLPAGTAYAGGADALLELAEADDVDLVVVASGGIVSLGPVLAALAAGKVVATANKETLVAGGHLVLPLARAAAQRVVDDPRRGPLDPLGTPLAWLRPIDSEHSAIWQCLAGERLEDVARLVLTASGGPFRTGPADLAGVGPADALAHPTWSMGAKITIDSATLMNKGLEVIEAHWLYDAPYEGIDVVVHPQSVVHSAVIFRDGSLKAQLGPPDMHLPIQYALTYPARPAPAVPAVTLEWLAALTFEPVDEARFPALAVARRAGRQGPWASAALIAADEVAVGRFLAGGLAFPGITRLVDAAVARYGEPSGASPAPDLPALLALDAEVRAFAAAYEDRPRR